MICKYCGTRVDPLESVCPKCGRALSLEGGNGFWDLAGEIECGRQRRTENTTAASSFADKKPAVKKSTPTVQVRKKSSFPALLCGILCIVCVISLIFGNNSTKKSNQRTEETHAEVSAAEAQIESLTGRISALEKKLAELEETLDDKKETAANTGALHIIYSPTHEEQEEGFACKEGNYLFMLRVEGKVISFVWEKQTKDGQWQPIEFTQNVNETYGLRLQEELEEGITKLIATGLTRESEGTYRCTAYGVDGQTVTATVALSLVTIEEGQVG